MKATIKKELARGLFWTSVWLLGVAAFLNNPIAPSAKTWLTAMGAACELAGVVLIASPELGPLLRWLLRWVAARLSAGTVRLMRLLRIPRSAFVRTGAAKAGATSRGSAVRVSGKPPEADTTAWLVEQVGRLDKRIDDLQNSVSKLPEQWRGDIAEAKSELEGLSRELVRRVAEANLALRLMGVAFVIVGIVLSAAGNLV